MQIPTPNKFGPNPRTLIGLFMTQLVYVLGDPSYDSWFDHTGDKQLGVS